MKRLLSLLLAIFALFTAMSPVFADDAARLLDAKRQALGTGEALLSGDFLSRAGTTAGDWYALGVGLLGLENGDAYAKALALDTAKKYAETGTLSETKATEYARVCLTLGALGYDPRSLTLPDGTNVDLIGDGIFYRRNIARQGVNGPVFALLTLSAFGLTDAVPDAENDAPSLLDTLKAKVLPDGGWALTGTKSDADVTAMALTALALSGLLPDGDPLVENALTLLSARQTDRGTFTGAEGETCETAAWVVVALCTLGLDPEKDPLFVKNGRSAADGFFAFQKEDGTFRHTLTDSTYDADLTDAEALLALAAMELKKDGKKPFDYRGKPLKPLTADSVPDEKPTEKGALGTLWDAPEKRRLLIAVPAAAVILGGIFFLWRKRRKSA